MKFVVAFIAVFVLVLFIGWLGLRVQPKPFAPFARQTGVLDTAPLPEGLPAPVERYYRQLYGDRIPLIQSAVISGRAVMSPVGGVKIPARFRFVHRTGQDYRHDFEMTWFGRKIGAGMETYLNGKSRLDLPMGLSDEGPQVDQAANLSLWAEYAWLPAVWLTDPRARWAPVDDETALLIVPFGENEQIFVARFDPESGRLRLLESMRYKDSKSTEKTLWLNESSNWTTVSGYEIPATGVVTWFDQGKPWAEFTVEDIVLNPDVDPLTEKTELP